MRTVFLAILALALSSISAMALPPGHTYTHNTTFAVPEQSYQEARLWFLPDYQDSTFSKRTDTAPSGSGDRNDADYTCEKTYNLNTSCTSPQIIEKTHNMGKITCYKCKCPDNYKTTSCKTGWHLSGTPCKIGTTSYYTGCAVDACPSGYTAGKTCGSGYTLEKSGQSGDQYCGKCVAKSCPSGYTAGLANCNGKTYPAGWTYSSNGYSGDSVCGKCTAKTCSSGTAGLANCNGKAQPSGWTYSSNGYAGDSVCGTCTAKSCPAGYTAGTTGCSNTTSWTYGSNGYAGDSICGKCTPKDCADGYTAGLANCNGKAHPAGWTYSTGTPSGSTVCGKCTAKACSAGTTSCPTGQVGDANGYYAGDSECLTCRVACTPTCPSGWSLTAPTNCKYGGSVTTADSAGCGSSCYRCEAMVATSCQQVIDHTTSKYPGKIVLEGIYDCGDKTITLADGQSLVGKSYYTGASESATSKSAGLIFSTTKSSVKSITATGNNTTIANMQIKHTATAASQTVIDMGFDLTDQVVKDVNIVFDSQTVPQFSGSSFNHTTGIAIGGTGATMTLKGNVYISNVDANPSNPTSRYNNGIMACRTKSGSNNMAQSSALVNIGKDTTVNVNIVGNFDDIGIGCGNYNVTDNAKVYTDANGSSFYGASVRGNAVVNANCNRDNFTGGCVSSLQLYDNAAVNVYMYGSYTGGLSSYATGGTVSLNSSKSVITITQDNKTSNSKCFQWTNLGCVTGSKISCFGKTYNCTIDTEKVIKSEAGDVPPSPWFVLQGGAQSCQPYFSTTGTCPAHGTCTTCPINKSYIRVDSCDEGWSVDGINCKQTCLYNKTYEPDGYRCETCKRLGTTYYGGTCYKDCQMEYDQNMQKCYQNMQNCVDGGSSQNVCYQAMDTCMYNAQMTYQDCMTNMDNNTITW